MANAIEIANIGKMYKLYNRPIDKVLDVFGIGKFRFWDSCPYKEFWALRNIDITIGKGERIGIIGKNGAGKSTLLKIIAGNIIPTEGNIKVNGNIQALMQLGTGFHPEFTGRENIKAALAYNGMSGAKVKRLEEEIIDFSELEDFIDQPIKVYSSGMYSRLAFAVSTVLEPDILIIDEVLGAGDASFITKCSDRMKKLTHDTGATVLFVSHSMDSVLEICEKAILIEKGRIVNQGSALEISKIYNKKIREEDDLLLKAKEYKIRKKDLKIMHNIQEENIILLFRLAAAQNHPSEAHKIYKCSLLVNREEMIHIDVGYPMDNDINSLNRIIDGIGSMDWSKSEKENNKYFRYYRNEGGANCHAPFQLALPRHISSNQLTLQIEAEIGLNEDVFLDLWVKNRYERIGVLEKGKKQFEFQIQRSLIEDAENDSTESIAALYSSDRESAEDNIDFTADENIDEDTIKDEDQHEAQLVETYYYESMKKSNSIYGSQEIIIESIDVVDKNGDSKRVFFIGDDLYIKMVVEANKEKDSCVFVVSILTTTGKPVGQVFCKSKSLGIEKVNGKMNINLKFSPLRLGQENYMVSIGVFKDYDLHVERENESYCVVDRAVFFKVVQPESMKKGIGAFAHVCTWEYQNHNYLYDATSHFTEEL
jgi:lipopolysaccharide transport system ATP-binding protein